MVQPCACLGLIRGFVTVNSSGVGLLVPPPKPNLEDQGLPFFWPLPFDLSSIGGLPGAYAPTSIALRATGARKHLHDKAVVLEEAVFICKVIKLINLCLVRPGFEPVISIQKSEETIEFRLPPWALKYTRMGT